MCASVCSKIIQRFSTEGSLVSRSIRGNRDKIDCLSDEEDTLAH